MASASKYPDQRVMTVPPGTMTGAPPSRSSVIVHSPAQRTRREGSPCDGSPPTVVAAWAVAGISSAPARASVGRIDVLRCMAGQIAEPAGGVVLRKDGSRVIRN